MALTINYFQCDCGWHDEWVAFISKRKSTIYQKLEKQLQLATNPHALNEWRSVYHRFVKGEFLEDDVDCRKGLATCTRCKRSADQMVIYNKNTDNPIHAILCNNCGKDVQVFHNPTQLLCPRCKQIVEKRETPRNPEDLLNAFLLRCNMEIRGDHSKKLVLAVGTRASKNIAECDACVVTIKRQNRANKAAINLKELLHQHKPVIFHPSIDSEFQGQLSLLLIIMLNEWKINFSTVLLIPPFFEGKETIDRVSEYLMRMQSYCDQFTVISGEQLKEKHGSGVELYERHIPNKMKDIIEE
jgi:hypothetical protein